MISCVSQKSAKKASTLNTNDTLNNNTLEIRYEARTRGNAVLLQVLENTLTYKTKKEKKTLKLTTENKKKINTLLENLDMENLKNLKSPTNKRMFDGAMIATLKIKKDDKEYSSSNFDHGHPPIELQSLVNLLIKIAN